LHDLRRALADIALNNQMQPRALLSVVIDMAAIMAQTGAPLQAIPGAAPAAAGYELFDRAGGADVRLLVGSHFSTAFRALFSNTPRKSGKGN
jgi:hypothetical protein